MARTIRWLFVAAIACVIVAGCGGAAVETTPTAPGTQHRALTDLDALEHDLSVSEQRLFASLEQQRAQRAEPPGASTAPAAPSGGAAPAPAQPESPPATEREAPADKQSEFSATESAAEPRAGTPCDIACRAFASMRRSAGRICELAGQSDERCARAKQRVEQAQSQIGRAACRCLRQD